ncbi:ArsR/SmtB family transcription factor [Yinghuangia sp. YIM S09857]|uniref:ArsR/SmtB family transcription factor n=1 Tax=Yinghuangia sp. YIM S09857 TaxID=3436929 RepID=UPI003F535D9E
MTPNGDTEPVPASDAPAPDAPAPDVPASDVPASDVSASDTSASGGRRRLDAQSLKGLAHPLRMRILELLSLDGAATSSTLARRLGENTGTVSWHLRHLAEHGFIEEEVERGTKRERWWRRVPRANQLDIADFRDDPASSGALSVYLDQLLRQYFERVTAYVGEDWDDEWRAAGTVADWRDLRLTADELGAMNVELADVVNRYRTHSASRPAAADSAAFASASADDGGAELRPVVVQLQSFPRKGPGPS